MTPQDVLQCGTSISQVSLDQLSNDRVSVRSPAKSRNYFERNMRHRKFSTEIPRSIFLALHKRLHLGLVGGPRLRRYSAIDEAISQATRNNGDDFSC